MPNIRLMVLRLRAFFWKQLWLLDRRCATAADFSPARQAIVENNVETLRTLLAKGADPDLRDNLHMLHAEIPWAGCLSQRGRLLMGARTGGLVFCIDGVIC